MKHAISFASFFAVAVYSARGAPGTDGGVSAVYTGVQQDIGSVYCVLYTSTYYACIVGSQTKFVQHYVPVHLNVIYSNKAQVYIKPYFAGWFSIHCEKSLALCMNLFRLFSYILRVHV